MGLIVSVGLFILSILVAAPSRIAAAEIEAWSPSVVRWLVRVAVKWLPEEYRERFGEEWRSHLDEVPGLVGKIIAATGFLLAAHKMGTDVRRAAVAEVELRAVAQLRQSQAKLDAVVNAIEGDKSLDSNESLQSLADRLRLGSGRMKESLDQLAQLASSRRADPPTIASRVLGLPIRRRVRRQFEQMLVEAKRSSDLSDQTIRLLQQRKRFVSEGNGPPAPR